jgi:hypothetical protein
MQDELILNMLKQDLEILHSDNEEYLLFLIAQAKELIARMGITLGEGYEDIGLVVSYAACKYRQRANPNSALTKMLQRELNNKLVSQIMEVTEDV